MTDKQTSDEILKLVKIMAALRGPDGCPWDRQQTPTTLKPYILEEAYELIEAIDNEDTAEILDELGDLLLQVIFIAQIFTERNKFGLAEVASSISNKLVRRHPHVFADANPDEHAQRWDEIKQQELAARGKGLKLADRIPTNLPALKKATKVAKKMNRECPTIQIHNIQDNISMLTGLMDESTSAHNQQESILGEILFCTVQLSNSLQLDAEDLLRKKTMQVINEIDI